jgi:hypothetical protein
MILTCDDWTETGDDGDPVEVTAGRDPPARLFGQTRRLDDDGSTTDLIIT